jgi:hypothetical protein
LSPADFGRLYFDSNETILTIYKWSWAVLRCNIFKKKSFELETYKKKQGQKLTFSSWL